MFSNSKAQAGTINVVVNTILQKILKDYVTSFPAIVIDTATKIFYI